MMFVPRLILQGTVKIQKVCSRCAMHSLQNEVSLDDIWHKLLESMQMINIRKISFLCAE